MSREPAPRRCSAGRLSGHDDERSRQVHRPDAAGHQLPEYARQIQRQQEPEVARTMASGSDQRHFEPGGREPAPNRRSMAATVVGREPHPPSTSTIRPRAAPRRRRGRAARPHGLTPSPAGRGCQRFSGPGSRRSTSRSHRSPLIPRPRGPPRGRCGPLCRGPRVARAFPAAARHRAAPASAGPGRRARTPIC